MRDTSSLGAATHSDCVLGATFVKSPANSLDVAGSVGRSAPTDPDRFLMVHHVVAISQQRGTHVSGPSWQTVDRHSQCYETLGVGHYTHKRSGPTSDIDCTFAIACTLESEVARSLHRKGPLVRDLRPPVVSVDDRIPSGREPVVG
ncbi:unnamed protein product [Peronospora effusa]|nr:unnamed protein product [Peronospora effusa]